MRSGDGSSAPADPIGRERGSQAHRGARDTVAVSDVHGTDAAALYLDLLKRVLTRTGFGGAYHLATPPKGTLRASAYKAMLALLPSGVALVRRSTEQARQRGQDWPPDAETMIGMERLNNLQDCVEDVVRRGVPGDLLEAGVWRGGATILMRATLKVLGVTDRTVWVADSFRGLPPARPDLFPADAGARWDAFEDLAVSLDQVKANFARYGLLDEQVRFLPGWFSETLASLPAATLAVLRVDGDMYESTMDILRPLYPKVSTGGYVIIDDYRSVHACQLAVDDYRREMRIDDPIVEIDGSAVFWRKGGAVLSPR